MRRTFAFLLIISVLASACSTSTTSDETSQDGSDAQGAPQPWDAYVVPVDLSQELVPPAPEADNVTAAYLMKILDPNRLLPTVQNQQAWLAETTVMTQYRARCYNEAGFPYFAVDEALDNPFVALSSDLYPFSREYAETYGLVSQSGQTVVPEALDRQDAQESFREGLSAEDTLIFDDLRLSCREATDSLTTNSHAEVALAVLDGYSINIRAAIANEPRFAAFEQSWVSCMAEQGYPYDSLQAMHNDADVSTATAVASFDCDGNEQWAITDAAFNDVIGPLVAEHLDEIKAAVAAG